MRCWFSGHKPPSGDAMDDAVLTDGFDCQRCGKRKRWSDYDGKVVVAVVMRRHDVMRERQDRRAAA